MDAMKSRQEHVYNALNSYFTLHRDDVLEIEILPPHLSDAENGHSSTAGVFLQDGLCIGIPKKALLLAYLEAKKTFFTAMTANGPSSQIAYDATMVMLLFDPEHITAANYRKRRLLGIRDSAGRDAFVEAATRETVFLDSILTSPLHRQSKSPTLWYHRAWLLNQAYVPKLEQNSGNEFVMSELDAVLKAGERHPKNYYAWQYARTLVTEALNRAPDDSSLVFTCAIKVKEWCCKHPSDISGWSFLAFLLPKIDIVATRSKLVGQVLAYAISLNWEGESIWAFIRTVLAGTSLQEERASLIEDVHKQATHHTMGQQATRWIELYQTPLSGQP